MLAKDTLRQSDVFSGALIALLGIFIVSQSMRMPMKDSWGGVQNVWYVSPALFPLLVGAMLILLGLALCVIGLRHLGRTGLRRAIAESGPRLAGLLGATGTLRFFAVITALLVFVFILVPRVDFFAASPLFLLLLFALFHYVDERTMLPTLLASLGAALLFIILFAGGLDKDLGGMVPHPGDWLALALLATLTAHGLRSTSGHDERRRRLLAALLVAAIAPLTIGVVFKYLLLVPMPHEGLVVQVLDAIRYAGH